MEVWKQIPGTFDRKYEVSSLGRVRSLPTIAMRRDGKPLTIPGKALVANPNSRGYPRVGLWSGNGQASRTVHSLVAAAFLPPPPGNLGTRRGQWTVNHKDGVKANNTVGNLEYIPTEQNYAHAKATGLLSHLGERNGRAKITAEQVEAIRRQYAGGRTQAAIAADFGVDQTHVGRIVRRANWSHGSKAQPGG